MTDDHPSAQTPDDLGSPERDPDQLPPLIRPAVDRIARIRATIHAKLLAGFLIIAAVLLAMGVTSILVIRQMNQRAHDQIELSPAERPGAAGDLPHHVAEPLPSDGA